MDFNVPSSLTEVIKAMKCIVVCYASGNIQGREVGKMGVKRDPVFLYN